MPLQVLQVINSLEMGGAQEMLIKLGNRLDQFGISTTILCFRGGSLIERVARDRVALHSLDIPSNASLFGLLSGVRRQIAEIRPDVVQSWLYVANLVCGASVPYKIPLAWNVRHSVMSPKREQPRTLASILATVPLACRTAAIVYNAEASARQHEKLGYRRSLRHVLPNGFDMERFAPHPGGRLAARRALGLPDNTGPLIGHVARYHPQKDHDGLVRAFAQLKMAYPSALLVLCGTNLTRENAALWRSITQAGVADGVALLGERNDPETIYQAADLFVLGSSHGEAFPNVLGEAMACEVPCVTTDVGDSALIVGRFGSVVPPGDPAALARAMGALLAIPQAQREEMGRQARISIADRFSLDRIASRYAELYRSLAARPTVDGRTGTLSRV